MKKVLAVFVLIISAVAAWVMGYFAGDFAYKAFTK